MELIVKKVPINFNLFLFGDAHEGNVLRHQSGWEQLCDMMLSSYEGCSDNYGVDHGDFCDAITSQDPRYHDLEARGVPLRQVFESIRHYDPIKKLVVTMLDGNHPAKLHRVGNLTKMLCDECGIKYGTWSAKITYVDNRGNVLFKHFCTHGKKGITSAADDPKRRMANMRIALKRHLKFKAGDTALMSKGHTHKLLMCEPERELYMSDDGKAVHQNYTETEINAEYIPPDLRWYVNTGSFLKSQGLGISGYAERAEYDPVELGFYILRFRDRRIAGIDKILLD